MLVDNGSTDGTVEYVRHRWPGLPILENKSNVGYGAAVGLGARLSPGADVLALNADTEGEPGFVGALSRTLHSSRDVGVVAPRLLNADGSVQDSCYPFPTLGGLLRKAFRPGTGGPFLHRRVGSAAQGESLPTHVDWASGAALLVRRRAWDEVGGFDPSYIFYVEEVDLQRRLADEGWKTLLEPRARVLHHGGFEPTEPGRFALSHDGFERYFGVRGGRAEQCAARLILCLVAAIRAAAWVALAAAAPKRRLEALRWARMFATTLVLSARRLPGAVRRRHLPYRPRVGS